MRIGVIYCMCLCFRSLDYLECPTYKAVGFQPRKAATLVLDCMCLRSFFKPNNKV